MKLGRRIKAFSVTHPFSMNRKLDNYLSEKLPDLMDEHKIADRTDLSDLDKEFIEPENRMEQLESWRKGFDEKISKNKGRLDRMKMKYGIEGGN